MSHFMSGTVATLIIAISPVAYCTENIPIAVITVAQNSAQAATQVPSQLSTTSDEVEEVLVFGLRKASYTVITENTEKLVNMPGSFGDPLGAVSALPGVIVPRDGGSPAVRGGAPEDNRYYIDGMPAGYIFHDFNTSIFDENVIQDFQLFSAGFGVQYSQATGAIFDIRLRDPENKELSSKLSLSFLRAGVFVENGLTDNSAFYLSARKGLLQYFISEDDEPDDDGLRIISPPEDSDFQFKYKWDINSEHSISFSFAGANDFAEAEFTEFADDVQKNPDFAGDAKVDKEFHSGGLNYEFVSESGAQLRVTLAKYDDSELVTWGDDYSLELQLDSELARAQYTVPLGSSGHRLGMGVEYNEKVYDYFARMIHFVCTDFDVDCQDGRGELINARETLTVAESSIYLLDNWQVNDRINLEVGVQRSGNDYTDDYFINPRASLSWGLTDSFALISSAGEYNRTPDVDNILRTVGNPELDALESKHVTYGFKSEFYDYWSLIVEGYHKELSKLPLALNSNEPDASLFYTNDIEGEVNGVDVMLNKNLSEKWFGWISISYAESERTNLRTGQTQTYTLDTPWLLNLVANYQLTTKWNAGFRFNYRTGEATTKIIGIRPNPDFPDSYLPVYGDAFGSRLPPYSRLDLRFERDLQMFGKESSFFIDILNVLNRENVSQRVLDYEKVNDTGELHMRDSVDMGVFGSLGVSIVL